MLGLLPLITTFDHQQPIDLDFRYSTALLITLEDGTPASTLFITTEITKKHTSLTFGSLVVASQEK